MSLETLVTVRFGTGRHPAKPDQGPAQMLAALQGPDAMAHRYPIPGFAVLRPIQEQVRKYSRIVGKNRGTAQATQANDARRALYRAERARQMQMLASTLARWAQTDDPLRERLTRFWGDHFTTVGKGGLTRRAVSLHIEDSIRPHVAGRFGDMLRAAVTHPMMLNYLDQSASVGPASELAQRRPERGLNENLAREVLELHTLGVGGPYTQTDVRQLAELFAGLFVTKEGETGFNPRRGEPGAETVLGRAYGGKKPALKDVHAVLDDLAVHPATARFIARKLAVHFVSDTPDPALVDAIARAFEQTGGDLMATYTALLTHEAALALPLRKAKQPFDLVATTLRALDVDMSGAEQVQVQRYILNPMRRMGQLWQEPTGPDGWPEDEAHWITPQGLAARIEWAMGLSRVEDLTLPDPRDFVVTALGPLASGPLTFAAGAAESKSDGIGLVLASPEFQRR